MPWPPADERLTEGARRALGFAQDEACRLNHNHLGPVHVFAGLVRVDDGLAARVLADAGVGLDRVRLAIESTMGRSADEIVASDITLLPRTQRVIDFAIYESRRLSQRAADTEHFLLALMSEGDQHVELALDALDLRADEIRASVLRAVDVPDSYGARSTRRPGRVRTSASRTRHERP
jgi:ATP-dependent Clp protease ATP-binding subunit ClpC